MERRLTTIVAADLVGYSRLMASDEERTIKRLRAVRTEIVEPLVQQDGGKIIKTMGDGLLAEFPSPVAAVRCVIEIQGAIASRENGPEEQRLQFRVGVNLGDVVEDGDDILGDGVNVAARLEKLSAPGGAVISRSVFDQLRGKVTTELAAMGPQRVKNIPDPVDAWRVEINGASEVPMTYDLPEKPSIIVLPFDNMSPDKDQEFFCDGLVEDLTTALSRFRQLFVIARNTAFTFKAKSVDVREVSRALGVRYVLEGSVRTAGQRLRVTAQLIDAVNDRHIWAEKFDGNNEDVFDFQDKLTASIAGAILPEVSASELENAHRRNTKNLSTWMLNARALTELAAFSPDSMLRALSYSNEALKSDPESSQSHAIISNIHAMETIYAWNRAPVEAVELSSAAARAAISLDRKNEDALGALGMCALVARNHSEAISLYRRALELNPNSVSNMNGLGMTLVYSHELEEGVELLKLATRLGPRDHWACFSICHVGFADFFRGDFEATIISADQAHQEFPQHPTPHRLKAACLGLLGRIDEARAEMNMLQKLAPKVTLSQTRAGVPFAYKEDADEYIEGLRRAGMPEN
ncbi:MULTISPECIES: adenylate/guanylate cyclase domain-containing protein [unclassified Ruegeria]|uniref:adenylate/guanylate cyclase domain-containing protein n=1 Tax=unclassified Ruegeria TaxID=2625375 RepID=UPI00147F24F4|nr:MULTISPECIES: adenylate/guanylate cyclase domain-containing protein [unclassified Ruegeria]NOD36660.1 tetratricopeptide repeat protein [Ruegeria sp. HKCCD7296]NOE43841.1 tetratricopeptide repeat protein [Ruegeria sp. HKCCD7319]